MRDITDNLTLVHWNTVHCKLHSVLSAQNWCISKEQIHFSICNSNSTSCLHKDCEDELALTQHPSLLMTGVCAQSLFKLFFSFSG